MLDSLLSRVVVDMDETHLRPAINAAVSLRDELSDFFKTLTARSDYACSLAVVRTPEPLEAEILLRGIDVAPPEALKNISARRDLDEACADRLVERGDTEVRRTVTRNLLAPLAAETQGKLLACAREDESLRIALLRRPHLAEDVSSELMDLMAKRKRPDKGSAAALRKLDTSEQAAIDRLLELYHRTSSNTQHPLTRDEIQRMADAGTISVDETLILFIASEEAFAAFDLIAERMGVPRDAVTALVGDSEEFGFAALVRRLSLSPASFAAILRFMDKRHRREPRPLNKLAASYFEHDARKLAIFIRQFAPHMGEDELPPAKESARPTRRTAPALAQAS